jgi:hypothetical protein
MPTISELQHVTNNLLMPIQGRLPDLAEEPLPAAVYHYTDAGGLQGILESGVLWATHYRFLNDSSELRYIFDLATEIAIEQLRNVTHGDLAQMFVEHVTTAPTPYSDTVYYLCCFSEFDNSLSQWRAYGRRQGFSLGFPGDITINPALIDVPARQGQTAGITLQKVEYRIERHTEYVTGLIKELIALCDGSHMKSYPDPIIAISHITPFYFGQLERASYLFKHPDFAEEREWRFVSWATHPEFFRVGATLTPYAKFQFFSLTHPNPYPHCLPLLAARHGPTFQPDETKLAMDRILASRGYTPDYCQRLGSATPVRL